MDVQPGDLVRLKSGGALMSVESVAGGMAHCLWQVSLDGRWETRRDIFPIVVLSIDGVARAAAGTEADDPEYKVYEGGDD